jgi:capsule polysaccharide export protein KpsE/RkpR
LAAGIINEKEAHSKNEKITNAEERLAEYEAQVQNGKKKLSDYKTNVSDHIKN